MPETGGAIARLAGVIALILWRLFRRQRIGPPLVPLAPAVDTKAARGPLILVRTHTKLCGHKSVPQPLIHTFLCDGALKAFQAQLLLERFELDAVSSVRPQRAHSAAQRGRPAEESTLFALQVASHTARLLAGHGALHPCAPLRGIVVAES